MPIVWSKRVTCTVTPVAPVCSVADLANAVKLGRIRQIVALSGAGLSTAAGIPDFRSAGGMFQELSASFPEVAHEPTTALSRGFYEKRSALPVWRSIARCTLGGFRPTPAHVLLRLLDLKGLLLRVYTQNVDGLHHASGLPEHRVFEVHGTKRTVSCSKCHQSYVPQTDYRPELEAILAGEMEAPPSCKKCGCKLQPDVVLYGDPLPPGFESQVARDFSETGPDCVLVLGTCLQVAPFCALPNMVPRNSVRVLANRPIADCLQNGFTPTRRDPTEMYANSGRCVQSSTRLAGRSVSLRSRWRDGHWPSEVLYDGLTDTFANEFVQCLGWEEEFNALRSAAAAGDCTAYATAESAVSPLCLEIQTLLPTETKAINAGELTARPLECLQLTARLACTGKQPLTTDAVNALPLVLCSTALPTVAAAATGLAAVVNLLAFYPAAVLAKCEEPLAGAIAELLAHFAESPDVQALGCAAFGNLANQNRPRRAVHAAGAAQICTAAMSPNANHEVTAMASYATRRLAEARGTAKQIIASFPGLLPALKLLAETEDEAGVAAQLLELTGDGDDIVEQRRQLIAANPSTPLYVTEWVGGNCYA
eukprot:TRINITY_DN7394_c0_g1_i1.p1 TRINITY_DN7394_c0_g1~~TRINITY_DN7394_c0_g1_i1.p1  ORF type:complete len:602 (-),score=63.14 TRINITY_DN7394_c0_g1_i1:13-1794(-)